MNEARTLSNSFRRFSAYRLFEHWANALCFVVLVVTGLSQKFYDADLSQWLVIHLGGIDMLRLIHRSSGAILTVLTLQHLLVAAGGVLFRQWEASILIRKRDVSDLIDNMKYYFGLRGTPASCDRYTYKQKFEYWGVLTGQLLMVGTGLCLWFPATTVAFLPGELIPAAKAVHSNHALFIILIITLWHIYNSIFSPEVFPMDTSIFTGQISRERMVHEHPLELSRLEGTDEEPLTPRGSAGPGRLEEGKALH